jgi:hypothetical protein
VAALSTDFARHYSFQPKACRPYRAKTKGKVERPFRYIREDFFLARSFRNLDDLNAQLRHWLDTVANPRVHATTQCVVNEAFAAEKPHLGALPLANRSICCGLRRAWSGSAAPAVGISLTWAFPRFWSRERPVMHPKAGQSMMPRAPSTHLAEGPPTLKAPPNATVRANSELDKTLGARS